jgi:phosphoribosylanthranilate isomerase
MIIKVCGMRDAENIKELSNLDIDFMGLIFYDKSPRFIGKSILPSNQLKKIGVFVNSTIEYVIEKITLYDLYGVQLHGDEDIKYVSKLRQELKERGYKDFFISKAFRMTPHLKSEDFEEFDSVIDMYILDSGGKSYGGNGKVWDYRLLDKLEVNKGFLLSGGIDGSVPTIELLKIHPHCVGVDLNSGFEIKPGLKDINKIKKFIN